MITGASDGIGQALARQLAAAGFHLLLVARSAEGLERVADTLRGRHGVDCRTLPCDLSQADAVAKVAAATVGLDVGLLVAAAGFGTAGAFLDSDIGTELSMIDVNCRAVVELTHLFGRRFADRGHGGIILMSSLVAFQGVPRAANYAATKAFIQTLAEGIRPEFKPFGVDVLAVAPGPIRSGFARRAKMTMGLSEAPEVVARQALTRLGRATTVRPGLLSKLLEYSLAPLPRRGRSRIMALVMAGMTRTRPAATGRA
ncbi:SDR family oxidoreductase [Brevundimonas sp. LM2]|uniref:SDR family NAD(P)-dependent oxidoreductase n=1 Tax=Brevundimonas sp. LM2 TaxID=1938605 RepID=UPI00209B3D3A|nr:SDR family NAD(P)-dependent oxidoreductase [Brevundimonas sp. LM2]